MKKTLRFIIALFGNRHAGMLLPLLYSIEKSNPEAAVSLYWEDIDSGILSQLQKTFPQLECEETYFNFSNDITTRISSKTLVWEQAARDKQNETGWLLFIDADMLVIKDVSAFLQSFNSDGVFTERDGRFPINSGVIAAQASKKTADLFTLWLKKTGEILKTPELYAQANNKNLPYGGSDQMALHQMLNYGGYEPAHASYEIPLLSGEKFLFSPSECADLNETYSVPVTDHTRIIHYKGGWRSILFENGHFTKNRPKKESQELYHLYIRYFQQAILKMNTVLGTHYSISDFGFSVPFYLNPSTLKERVGLYRLFFLRAWISALPKRISTFIHERILTKVR